MPNESRSPDVASRSRAVQRDRHQRVARGFALANVVLGGWLMMAPFLLPYTELESALWSEVGVGTFVVGLALYRLAAPRDAPWIGWGNVLVGAWLVAAPFVLEYTDVSVAMWHDVVAGIVVVGLALVSMRASGGLRAGT